MKELYNKAMNVLATIMMYSILIASMLCIAYGLGGILVLLFS